MLPLTRLGMQQMQMLGAGAPAVGLPTAAITDLFNGFNTGSTFTGGPTVVRDYLDALVSSPAGVPAIEGGRLLDGVWYATDPAGADIWPSTTLRTRQGSRKKYDATFKGYLNEPARTNIFLNSQAPVTQGVTTTAQQYTVSVIGTGSVTVSGTATGVATESAPLTVTATAGTLTCTVAGTLTHVQVEAGAFATSPIYTAAAPVTRPATNLTRPTAGVLRDQNCVVWGRVIPSAGGQTSVGGGVSTFTDASNELLMVVTSTEIKIRKRTAIFAGDTTAILYTHSANTPFEYRAFWSDRGFAIQVKQDGGAWSAWATNANADLAVIASTLQIGGRAEANHFAGNYPFLATAFLPAQATLAAYQNWIETNPQWNLLGA